MKRTCFVFSIFVISAAALAQDSSVAHTALSVWNIHTRDVITSRAVQNDPIAVLTPAGPIVVRRLEALSIRGPVSATIRTPEPTQCPLTFFLEITNGSVSQTVPISTAFLRKG
jgi:hypothetical protein